MADSAAPVKADDQLPHLIAEATASYARKNYNEASGLYATACELQATINGELAIQNAHLLYEYGRCLYHVAVSNSDVLGAKAAAAAPIQLKKKRKSDEANGRIADAQSSPKDTKRAKVEESNHLEINGDDDDWGDTDEESMSDHEDREQEAEEDIDDFANAWEILDMARCILVRKLDGRQAEDSGGVTKGKAKASIGAEERRDKDMLADTFDLQAEIALENENFAQAVESARDALGLQEELYGEDSTQVATGHFKLALALEFASLTPAVESGAASHANEAGVDHAMRAEAVQQLESSIACTRLRLNREERELAALEMGDEAQAMKMKSIAEVKEMLEEMVIKVSIHGIQRRPGVLFAGDG